MENRKVNLNFRQIDKNIYESILNGTKKVETRAASIKFRNLKKGDIVILKCGKGKAEKKIKIVKYVKNIDELLQYYKVTDVNPDLKTKEDMEKMYYSFPDYKKKITKYGLVSMEFEV